MSPRDFRFVNLTVEARDHSTAGVTAGDGIEQAIVVGDTKMKRVLNIAICWIVISVLSLNVYSQDNESSPAGGQGSSGDSSHEKVAPTIEMSEIIKPLEDTAKQTRVLSIFLRDSNANYNKATRKIEQEETEYSAAVSRAASDEEKRQLTLGYLSRRVTFIDSMTEDLDFVNSKLAERARVINSLIGEFSRKSALIRKAEQAAQDTTGTVNRIEALKREARSVKAESPEPGSEEYMTWFSKQLKLRIDFRREVGVLRRSLRKANLYNKLGKCMKLTKADTLQWQAFILTQTVAFSEAEQDLLTEKLMAQDYIEFVKATSAFGDIKLFPDFAKNFSGMVSKLTESELPDPIAFGGIGDMTPPDIKLESLDDILDFDPHEYIKKVRQAEPAGNKSSRASDKGKENADKR